MENSYKRDDHMHRNENFIEFAKHAEIVIFFLAVIIFLVSGEVYFFWLSSAIAVIRWASFNKVIFEKLKTSTKYDILSKEIFILYNFMGINVLKSWSHRYKIDEKIEKSKTFGEAFDACFDSLSILFWLTIMIMPHFSNGEANYKAYYNRQLMELLYYIIGFRLISVIFFKVIFKVGFVK
ncbi:hypothetical protein [Vogesella indigofera]|uniref:hypothetical protein n=1 Tax=Vogesella indigofera TaxID=45465 RepID=UPI0011C4353A|nr:hypothetical protein [Vogesella indigofera]